MSIHAQWFGRGERPFAPTVPAVRPYDIVKEKSRGFTTASF